MGIFVLGIVVGAFAMLKYRESIVESVSDTTGAIRGAGEARRGATTSSD
jgi:hypothetical protein